MQRTILTVNMYLFIIALFTTLIDLLTVVQFQNHYMKKKNPWGSAYRDGL